MPTMSETHAAHERGELIEVRRRFTDDWSLCTNPIWNWGVFDYRIAEIEERVPDNHRYVARDLDGSVYSYHDRPTWHELQGRWETDGPRTFLYQRGTCHARDSLICRS